ncbi:putative Dynein axonemal assembly factor 3 [Blattamonas nauphoetae]|uniref:Dynein axonemal assembly factor 3 n=1 Tax=Blattamonas nauphoetae TaxID=2049346 RepID=A0ABQ9XIG9_9EUKA|nr:putative Dynein axonemal assembly factor 3 [Blattamonas nauphoetae]
MNRPDPLLLGVGSFILKGLTPAKNFIPASLRNEQSLSSILVNNGDIRHIFATLAELPSNFADRSLTIYLCERNAETIARDLLHLLILNDISLDVNQRAELFLDSYGNLQITEFTADYIKSKIKLLIDFIYGKPAPFLDSIDCSLLTFRNKDALERIFKDWLNEDDVTPETLWDMRLKEYYGDRYDSRRNMVDWDLHMKLKDLGASIVYDKEFLRWRMEGLAFPMREGGHTKPNLTLITTLAGSVKGTKVNSRGYWGDIVNGPYFSFGLECKDQSLFKTADNKHVHSSGQVSMQHVRELLTSCDERWKGQKGNVRIIPIIGEYPTILKPNKFTNIVNIVCLDSTVAKDYDVVDRMLIKNKPGFLLVDTPKFILDIKPEIKKEFVKVTAAEAQKRQWVMEDPESEWPTQLRINIPSLPE